MCNYVCHVLSSHSSAYVTSFAKLWVLKLLHLEKTSVVVANSGSGKRGLLLIWLRLWARYVVV